MNHSEENDIRTQHTMVISEWINDKRGKRMPTSYWIYSTFS